MMPDIPSTFLSRMSALLGDEFAPFLASYEQPAVTGLRANTLKIVPETLAERLSIDLLPVPWSTAAFVVAAADRGRPGKHPYHAAGLYYMQDPSALMPVEILDPQPGETVLDLSAAPGGKSTQVAARLAGKGLLVANEVVPKRGWELAGNLERWGATNVAITAETPERLAQRFPSFFDAVLVDAPCSGEGTFRKSPAARQAWSPALVEGCALRQHGILEQAAQLVRPGGRLVYSTCTFAPEEDEGAVARFLLHHPEFVLAEPPARPGFCPGRPDWLPSSLAAKLAAGPSPDLARCVRLWPHRAPGEGHFAALLVKSNLSTPYTSETPAGSPAGSPAGPPAYRPPRLPKLAQSAFDAFIAKALADAPAPSPTLIGSYLYALPPGLPDLSGLRFLHPGWWLGEIKKDRFEPSHAFALGLAPSQVRQVADYPVESDDLLAYLRGETLVSAGVDGWTLISVDGFSLGWGKRVAGRLKSHYPKGLRRV